MRGEVRAAETKGGHAMRGEVQAAETKGGHAMRGEVRAGGHAMRAEVRAGRRGSQGVASAPAATVPRNGESRARAK